MGTIVLIFTLKTHAQNESGDKIFTSLKELVESKAYVFHADHMLPASGPSKYLTDDYKLTIKDNKATADLPYYGEAYNVSYGGDGGIEFDNEYQEYKIEIKEKKKKILVRFKIRGDKDFYKCLLTITGKSSVTLNVQPNNRQSIQYWGDLKPLSQE